MRAGAYTRLSFGDFSVNRDENGTTTAAISLNMAWEKILDDRTLTGSTIGLNFSRTDVDSEMYGISNGVSFSGGVYGVRRFERDIYGYAFIDVGMALNSLNVRSADQVVTGDFRSAFIEAGAALSGEYVRGDHTVVPEVEADIARIWLDGDRLRLSSDGGSPVNLTENGIWYASLRFTPEYRFSLDRDLLGKDWSTFFVEPEIGCEYVSALNAHMDCGGGLGIGLYGQSRDAMTSYEVRIDGTRYGSRHTYGIALKFEHRF